MKEWRFHCIKDRMRMVPPSKRRTFLAHDKTGSHLSIVRAQMCMGVVGNCAGGCGLYKINSNLKLRGDI
jgi:hypothetical protein